MGPHSVGTGFRGTRPWVPQGNMWYQKNDSLSRIAKRELGSYDRWIDIYNNNLDKIKDANVLQPGMRLVIPGDSLINEDGRAMDYNTDRFIKGIQDSTTRHLRWFSVPPRIF